MAVGILWSNSSPYRAPFAKDVDMRIGSKCPLSQSAKQETGDIFFRKKLCWATSTNFMSAGRMGVGGRGGGGACRPCAREWQARRIITLCEPAAGRHRDTRSTQEGARWRWTRRAWEPQKICRGKITRLVGSMGVCLLMIGRVPAILWELLERERENPTRKG